MTDEQFTALNRRFDRIEDRLERVESEVQHQRQALERIESEVHLQRQALERFGLMGRAAPQSA